MILKLLINFYHWLWSLPPLDKTSEAMSFILFTGALIDIGVLIGIIVPTVITIQDRWQKR
jgi:hypothetical protein